jgi:tetratricopeptide (TPR) repeat protein
MKPVLRSVGLAGLLACGALLTGCGQGERVWIEESAADSRLAERALAEGRTDHAVAHLERIALRQVPGGVAEEDARVVRQDAYDRWARIELERGDARKALRLVDRALALGEREDVFTANLLTTRGRIREAEGEDREAARDYHRALRIEEVLLERALGGGDER